MNEEELDNLEGFEVEGDWRRINKMLASREPASWLMAVVEARKVFVWVLDNISYGANVDSKLHNASILFKDLKGILAAEKVYQHIVTEIDHQITPADAKLATDGFFQGALDMLGRDFEPRNWWVRMNNSLNYFWGHHPKLLVGAILILLAFVTFVWFLSDTGAGHWIVSMTVGFAHFVLSWTALVWGILGALVLAMIISAIFAERSR